MKMSETEKQVFCCCFSKTKKPTEVNVAALSQNCESALVAVILILETFIVAFTTLAIDPVKIQKVPFSADLPKDLNVGKAICVSGIILPKCSRFAVNLTCGRSPTADVAFHLNPRMLQRYIVRNSRINGQWGNEEKTSTVGFPFGRSHGKFNLSILIADGEFLVEVDGVHVCTYSFRLPWTKITAIEVQGDVDVLGVEYKQLEKYPERPPEANIVKGHKENIDSVLKTGMDTPVTFLLPSGFRRDCQLEIYGRVKILPHSFYVNLQQGSQRWPHAYIPLHLNPRFGMGSESLFVRNAWIDNGWGQEERSPGFQFQPGSPFTMAIRRGDGHFSVWIDGKLAGEFKFRGDVDNIDTVHIEGDVVIFHVIKQENSDKLGFMAAAS